MDKKVLERRLAAMYPNALKNKETAPGTKKISGRTFNEELKAQSQTSGNLPAFPFHKARHKTITADQANKLAKYSPLIKDSAARNNVPVELICGVMLQESGGNHRAASPAGAKGLMQLMPQTAHRFGVRNSFDPAQNIEGGTKYLRSLLDRYNGNVELTLAAYNAGEKSIEKYGGKVPPFTETKNYIPNVLGYCAAMIDMLQAPAPPATIALRGKVV